MVGLERRTDDLERGLAAWNQLLNEAAARGETHSLIDILYRAIICECAAGLFAQAQAHADEGCELARDRGAPVFASAIVHAGSIVADAIITKAYVRVFIVSCP